MAISQQINLYQPIFRKQPVAFSFWTGLLLAAIVITVMFGIYGYGKWQLQQMEVQLGNAQQYNSALKEDIAAIEKKLPEPKVNRLLEQEITQLTERRKTGLALLNTLRTRIEGNPKGFSGYFEGLARQTESGLWFTLIDIKLGGRALNLSGETVQPELVPNLLQRLEKEAAFNGKTFQVMKLKRGNSPESDLEFSLITSSGEAN